jgi:hypothetical protein
VTLCAGGVALSISDEIVANGGVLVKNAGFLAVRQDELAVVGPVIVENSAVVAVQHAPLESEPVDEFGPRLMDRGNRVDELMLRKGLSIGLEGDGDGGADRFGCLEGVQCQACRCRVGWVLAQGFHLRRVQVRETERFVCVPNQQERAVLLDVDAVASELAVVRETGGAAEALFFCLISE